MKLSILIEKYMFKTIFFLLLFGGVQLLPGFCKSNEKIIYPQTKVEVVTEAMHGQEIQDPYRWLEDSESKEVQDWTDKQNKFTRSILDKLPYLAEIKKRLRQLCSYTRMNVPYRFGTYYFFTKNEGLEDQYVLYVQNGLKGRPEVLIDPNKLSPDGTVSLDWWYPSEDGKFLAYGLSQSGDEQSVLHIKNVETKADLSEAIGGCRFSSIAWMPDSGSFFYTRFFQSSAVPKGGENYYQKVYYHKLGESPENDEFIFDYPSKKEVLFWLNLSKDGRFLVIFAPVGSANLNEVYFKDLLSDKKVRAIVKGFDAHYTGEVFKGRLYLLTNKNASNYKLMKVDLSNPDIASWKEIIPEQKDLIEDFSIIDNKIVIKLLQNACSSLKIYSPDGNYLNDIKLPAIGTVSGLSGRHNINEMFYAFTSFVYPPEIYRYDFLIKKPSVFFKTNAPVKTDNYVTKQVWFKSKDQTPVPMFITCRKTIKLNGKNPCLLTGYGGFNLNQTPYYSAINYLWLENGGIFAVPNLRGGGEFGENWHREGMLDKKQNTFDDFTSAAGYLIDKKYTSSDRLAISGGSNGGLLVGAVLTQAPELFKAVICTVPLLDMLRYHKFLIARYWIPEYGSADDPVEFKNLYSYSPYHNVKENTRYPAVFIRTAQSDTRVDPFHARKMAALLQHSNASENPILLFIETKAGHGSGKPLSKVIDQYADIYTFLFWQLQGGFQL